MMSKTIDFIFDFGSPNAYFSHQVLPKLAAEKGASINYIPCLLGGIFKLTNNQAPMVAFANVKGKVAYDMLEIKRFIEKHGLTKFQMNPHFPVNTLLLVRGAIAADKDGRLGDYIEVGLKAMWEDGLNMSDPEVFAKVFTDGGFDGAKLLAATQDQSVKDQLMANTSEAVERGAFGIPTFYVGDEMFFGKDRIEPVSYTHLTLPTILLV